MWLLKREVIFMTDEMKKHIFDSALNGVITTKKITEMGIRRSALTELVESEELVKCSRGVYMVVDEWEDEFYLLQKRYSKGVFSHATALYLLGYSERVPISFHMTFVNNYNSLSLKAENVVVTRVIPDNYKMGITMATTPSGNIVKVYNVERCLCDMVKGAGADIQTVQYAMKKYAASKEKDINRLMQYAKQLRVEKKIRNYMEVLL